MGNKKTLRRFRFCKFANPHKMMNGKMKVMCGIDGSVHNTCDIDCPHLNLTFLARVRIRMIEKRGNK